MQQTRTLAADADCLEAECRSGKRNRFFRGKRMKADEFILEQRYFIRRRRLINRAVFGWGVVYGFALSGPPRARVDESSSADALEDNDKAKSGTHAASAETPKPLIVGAGLAFDAIGCELLLTTTATLDRKNTFVLHSDASGYRPKPLDQSTPGRYLLSAHYAERPVGQTILSKNCGCGEVERPYVCEEVVFSLTPLEENCPCPCAETGCDADCGCAETDSCGNASRGPHVRLCNWATETTLPEAPACSGEWNGYSLSFANGVGLACVAVEPSSDPCIPAVITSVDDACSPRRVVKTNYLLYDLLRGCDLTRISWISWNNWHRSQQPVPWSDFAAMLQVEGPTAGATNFVVRFSCPIRIDTILRDAVIMTAFTADQPTGWRTPRRIPITMLDPTPDPNSPKPSGGLPPGTTDQIRLVVRPRWIADEVEKEAESWMSQREFVVEIEVRGDLLLDCNGQAVDANPVGLRATPSGNGSPGGTFLSSFRVMPKPLGGAGDNE